nr:RNA-directed DNA polymerase, eukaryota [Tanacetum cinerariifolium]
MNKYGYKQSNSDHTLFLKRRGNLITCLIIYVDDMIITGDDKEEIANCLPMQIRQEIRVTEDQPQVRVIKAIHGDDGKVRGYMTDGAKSCWLSIVNEINSLKNKGINLLDFMHVKLGNGDKTAFWEDIWIEGKVLKNRQMDMDFEEFGRFSVASARKVIDDKSLPKVDSKTRWIKYVPIKVNVHAWKVKTDSLPTRFNVSRRGIHIDSIMCAICDKGAETSSHLFFSLIGGMSLMVKSTHTKTGLIGL